MTFKRIFMLICLFICLFAMASVWAGEANDTTIAAENSLEIDQTAYDVIEVEEDTGLASQEENEILTADEQSFAQLNATINGNADKDIYLNSDYKYSSGDHGFEDGIVINRDVTIYGNGHIINGSNEARIFIINSSNVVLYNITFTNGNVDEGNGGGAIYGNCKVINCTFKENRAYNAGGAMYYGSAVNCTFSGNSAYGDGGIGGGALFYGSAVNCIFTGNIARCYNGYGGGAIYNGSAINCTFIENTANAYNNLGHGGGGAIYDGNAINCTFIGNSANSFGLKGGAIYNGNAVNCTFSYNYASGHSSTGGAMNGGSAVNCNFSNNYASGTYSAGGAMNGGSAVNCNFSNNYASGSHSAGGAMNWGYKVNCVGQSSGDYYGTQELALHWDADDFTFIYGSGETLPVQLKNQNDELVDFIDYDVVVYNGSVRVKSYSCLSNNGLSIDLPIGVYTAELIVTYPGLTVEPKNITVKITDGTTFSDLNKTINNNLDDIITLDMNYSFNPIFDADFTEGIVINRPFTVNGNGCTIDADEKARIFKVTSDNAVLENITFKNGNTTGDGGAVYFSSSGSVRNCNFIGNNARYGGAILFDGEGTVTNCNFTDNKATGCNSLGGAVYFNNNGNVTNCNFTNNTATNGNGGAVYFGDSGNVTNCNFTNNTASNRGGAVYFNGTGNVTNCNFVDNKATGDYSCGGAIRMSSGTVTNCNFTGNTATVDGGAVFFSGTGNVTNCNFTDNSARNGGAISMGEGTVSNCNFTDNTANRYGGAINMGDGTVSNCNFTNNSATYDGGAIIIYSGTVSNCNFTDNSATENGGAVYFVDSGTVSNCNFTGNTATLDGGAVYFSGTGTGNVTNCNFTDNTANRDGGAVYFSGTGNVTNCNFVDNTANRYGGAIRFRGSGTVTNCNFTNNKATGNYSCGGAIRMSSGTVANCNFTGNSARNGGAVYFYDYGGSVSNCNFTNNKATGDDSYGGAVYISSNGIVSNCNFAGNTAGDCGGAISRSSGTVSNCNFTNNSAGRGGAINTGSGSVSNCNFADNTVTYYGGAVFFDANGEVTNCNFTGNNATNGSAIYFNKLGSSDTLTVSDSTFLNNRANAGALDIVKTENNITITFTGQNSLLNAIYSRDDAEVTFTNVIYWGAKGITTVSATMSGSNKATGQNITVGVVVNNELVLSDVIITNENGTIVLDISAGENYYISARHVTDSYYTEAERTISNNTKFNVNVTSQTTNNKTVNITAESNIPNDVVQGKLLFIVPNTDPITANYAGNGTWWAVYTFAEYGDYQVNASFEGLDNVAVNNATISISKIPTNISVNTLSLDLFVGDETVIVATLTPADAGNVTFTSSDEDLVLVEDDGNVIANGEGQAIITVSFAGNDKYAAVNKTINVTVRLNNANVTVDKDKLDLKVGETYQINATKSPDTILLDITYTSSNTAVVRVDKNGIVTAVGEGTAIITVTVGDDDIYAINSTNVSVSVSKAPSEITARDVSAVYNTDKYLIVNLKDSTGKALSGVKVSVDLKGVKEYTTDKNGQVKVPTKGLAPKTYTAKITFKGDNKYVQSTKEVKVTVKKATPKIIAKKKTYKVTSAKKFKITLKDNTGKPIKNAKVRLIVKKIVKKTKKTTKKTNKKKYKKNIKKTNKKGKATFKFKRNKKGKYQAIIKYYGNKYFKAITKKVKIIIK